MLSKQQKLKYGQMLRQQMREKQDKKKVQQIEKRGGTRQIQPSKQQILYKPTIIQKQNSYQRPYVDPKQQLQKKLQSQDYNYFGGLGGGAPNRRVQEQNIAANRNMSQPNNLRIPAEQMMQYSDNANYYQNQKTRQPRLRTSEQDINYYPQNVYNQQNQQQSISPQSINYQRQGTQMNYSRQGNQMNYARQGTQRQYVPESYNNQMLGRSPYQHQVSNTYQQKIPVQNQPSYNYDKYNQQFTRQPISYEYMQQNAKHTISRLQQNVPQYAPQNMQSYQANLIQQPNINLNSYGQQPNAIRQQLKNYPPQQSNNLDRQNQQLQQVYRKGGRNLLKLENQTIDEHLIKQKRKLEIQKQLKQQIQEVERRKKQEKERLKREDEEEQRKHKEYLAEQKRKLDDEVRKKQEDRQRIVQDNLKNLQRKKQMEEEAKRKAQQDQRDRQQKQKREKEKQKQLEEREKFNQNQERQTQNKKNKNEQVHYSNQDSRNDRYQNRIPDQDSTSVVSSDTSSLQKGFNTALSKQFFRKQREKNNPSMAYQNQKLQKVTNQIQKMSNQIVQQRQMFDRQIFRVKQEAQRVQIDKNKAEQQIQRLKKQLKRKMDDDNQKLLRALQVNDYRNKDFSKVPPQYSGQNRNLNQYQQSLQNQQQYPSFGKKKPLKQKESQNLVQQQYEPKFAKYQPKPEDLNHLQQSNVGLISLDGDSKKIPLYIQQADKLTLSQVQHFAKDSAYFQKGGLNGLNRNSPMKPKYSKINQSIAQETEQDRDYDRNASRKSNRNKQNKKQSSLYGKQKDELDKLMQSRAKSRGGWGQMSSVNSDITKQIQQLLKKKDNPLGNNGRPSSISNAGKQSLSRQGYNYDGITLNSNMGGGTLNTNGTMDLDRINGRNDARLRELKNLGVQTVNTNGDDDLNALDQLLNKYK